MKDLNTVMQELRALKPELDKRFGIISIEIFGSYARGEAKSESDLDLLVEFRKPIGGFTFTECALFLESELGLKVDLIPSGNIKPNLKKRIIQEKVPV